MIKLLRKFDVILNKNRRKEILRIFEHTDFDLILLTVGDFGKIKQISIQNLHLKVFQ